MDFGASDLDVTRVEDGGDFVLLGEFPAQFKATTDFKFGIAVEIKGQRTDARLEIEFRLEEIRIFVKAFPFVAALRNFDREDDRTARAKKIALAKLDPADQSFVGAIAGRESELFALGLLGLDVEKKHVFICDRCRFDLESVEQTSPHQGAKFFVENLGAVSLAL